jgi:hypothetical protein
MISDIFMISKSKGLCPTTLPPAFLFVRFFLFSGENVKTTFFMEMITFFIKVIITDNFDEKVALLDAGLWRPPLAEFPEQPGFLFSAGTIVIDYSRISYYRQAGTPSTANWGNSLPLKH